MQEVVRVRVRNNIVQDIEPCRVESTKSVPTSNLEVGTLLARNNQANGCIDGDYDFLSVHDAKDFAVLCLEFSKLLLERALASVKAHNFYNQAQWLNRDLPHAGGKAGG